MGSNFGSNLGSYLCRFARLFEKVVGVGGDIMDDVKMGDGRKGGNPLDVNGSADERQKALGETRGEAEKMNESSLEKIRTWRVKVRQKETRLRNVERGLKMT